MFPGKRHEIVSMTDVRLLFTLAEADDASALVAALSECGSSAPVVNDNGETLFLFSLYRGRAKCVAALEERGGLTLHEAAAAGCTERIGACLQASPWAIQTLSADGWPALHLAAFLGRDAAVVRLLELGANARQWGRAFEPNLAIHAACAGRRLGGAAFAKLIEATGEADAAQKGGYTSLMIAAGNGFAKAVAALLAAGADRNRKTDDGKTAADFARERGHAELAALLDS
jgi:hypothetical protein